MMHWDIGGKMEENQIKNKKIFLLLADNLLAGGQCIGPGRDKM